MLPSIHMKPKPPLEMLILTLRQQKVILDADLAEVYGVPTKVFNQAVRRNQERFPEDFRFQLTAREWAGLKSQIASVRLQAAAPERFASNWSQFVTSPMRHRGAVYRPYAFTEHGVAMLSSVLKSKRAVAIHSSAPEYRGGTIEELASLADRHVAAWDTRWNVPDA